MYNFSRKASFYDMNILPCYYFMKKPGRGEISNSNINLWLKFNVVYYI